MKIARRISPGFKLGQDELIELPPRGRHTCSWTSSEPWQPGARALL